MCVTNKAKHTERHARSRLNGTPSATVPIRPGADMCKTRCTVSLKTPEAWHRHGHGRYKEWLFMCMFCSCARVHMHARQPVRIRMRYDILLGRPSIRGCSAYGLVLCLPRRCSLRLLLFCTCPPLCAGAPWPMPAWVWRDVRF